MNVGKFPSNCVTLCVEDDHDSRCAIREVLTEHGISVVTVTNGRDALDFLRSQAKHQRVSMILCDLMMPLMDGQTFIAEKMKDPKLAEIPLVVMSAHTTRTSMPGAVAVLKKPLNLDDILQAVERHFCTSLSSA